MSFARVGATGWKLVVADTGIGIAREDMESLFGEFNRLRPNSAVDGTGLGLAICKEYAELLGGRIEAFSGAEQGTRFEVILPMTAAAAPLGESVGAAGVRVSPHSPAARAGR